VTYQFSADLIPETTEKRERSCRLLTLFRPHGANHRKRPCSHCLKEAQIRTPIGLQRVSFEDRLKLIPFKGILTDKSQIRNDRINPVVFSIYQNHTKK